MSTTVPAGEIITEVAELRELEPEWWALWRRSPTATPFQSPAWLIPWWEVFAPGRLRVVTIREGTRLTGLGPFHLEEGPKGRRLLPLGIGISDTLDVLADAAIVDSTLAAMADLVRGIEWDAWSLEELPPGALALRLPCPGHVRADTAPQATCPVLPLGHGELGGHVPAKRRRQLRRSWLAARAKGAVEIEVAGEDTDGFLADLRTLHRSRWTSRGEPGLLDDPDVVAFHRRALPGLARAGLLRATRMRIGGALAGAYYGLIDGAGGYAYLGGFDPEFSQESPGSILIADAIAHAASQGCREFHFLRGGEDYKYRWGAVDRWNQRRSFTRQGRP